MTYIEYSHYVCFQVFKSTSGEKLMEIQAHDDEVLCCAFSPDDRLLATCSSDRKVKVSSEDAEMTNSDIFWTHL